MVSKIFFKKIILRRIGVPWRQENDLDGLQYEGWYRSGGPPAD